MWLKTDREQLCQWGHQIANLLFQKEAARVGETSVLSRKVHTIDPARPGTVNILLNSDAGVVFYQRSQPGEVLHLDIFHSLGKVDHRQVAEGIRNLVREELHPYLEGYPLLDYVDLQTGTGGGRLSGSLNYGQKDSLRRAHINHVHLAAMLPDELLGCLVPVVAVVEGEVIRQGHEIRKVDGLAYYRGEGQHPVDLSAYSSLSDSLLKGEDREQGQKGQFRPVRELEQLQTALDLTQKVMNPRELKEILEQFTLDRGRAAGSYSEEHQALLRQLQALKLVQAQRGKFYLTEAGVKFKEFLQDHLTELESYFRKMLRKIPLKDSTTWGSCNENRRGPQHGGCRKKVQPIGEQENFGELAVPESLLAAGKRWLQGPDTPLSFQRQDLHRLEQKLSQALNICLLIDASASMAGERLRAAKYLAQHLVLATRDRVAVIVFQEQEVRLVVPFTRNLSRLQKGLQEIRSYGLTPLSLGLRYAIDYMEKAKKRKDSLLFVITDGIPTVSTSSQDPDQDALAVADEIARKNLHFTCIGLAPNKHYLRELTQRGKGNLYIISELQGKILAQIFHHERNRVQSH